MLRKCNLRLNGLRQVLSCRQFLYLLGLIIIVVTLILGLWYWFDSPHCLIFEFEERNRGIVSLKFINNSDAIIVGTMDGNVEIWDIEKRNLIMNMEIREPAQVACHPDGLRFATNWRGDCIRCGTILSPSEELFCRELPHVEVIEFSPSGKLLAAGGLDGIVKVWDASSGQILATFADHTHSVDAIAFREDRLLATGGAANTSIRIWDLSTKKLLTILDSHMDYISAFFFLNDATLLTMGSDRNRLASVRLNGTIRTWDIYTGDCILSHSVNSPIRSGAVSLNKAHFFAGCTNGMLLVGENHTLNVTNILSAHQGNISSLAVSSDGNVLVSTSDDLTRPSIIRFWDVNCMCRGRNNIKGRKENGVGKEKGVGTRLQR